MSVVIGGVVCQEIVEGLEEGIHDQGPVAQKKYLCDWGSRYALANAMLGLVHGQGGTNPSITFQVPQQYPQSLNMWAREISIKGVGQPTQGPVQLQFPKAIVTVNYAVPQFGYLSNPDQSLDPSNPYIWATQEIDFARQSLTIERSSLQLANGHKFATTQPYSLPLPTVIMSITLHKVPYLPAAQIITAIQKPLNNATYLGIGAGYLMFNGGKSHMEASTDGTYTQELTLNFAYRPLLRWDEVYDPDGVSGPVQVQYNGAAILLRSDLSTLVPSAYHG